MMGCHCRGKGKLYIEVESDLEEVVVIKMKDAHHYIDFYRIYIRDGRGKFMIDSIQNGTLHITSNIDDENVYYYPNHEVEFKENHYINKINIIDRRK